MSDVNRREARVRELERIPNPTPQQRLELDRLYNAIDRDTNRGAQRAESGQTGTRGEMKRPGLKTGGYVKTADGVAQRGKTKGRMI